MLILGDDYFNVEFPFNWLQVGLSENCLVSFWLELLAVYIIELNLDLILNIGL